MTPEETMNGTSITSGIKAMTSSFKELLPWFRGVTKEFMRQKGEWDMDAQIRHVFTEVGELSQALRKNKSLNEVLLEIWDVVLSAITVSHLLEVSDERMLIAYESTINKLKWRMENKHYEKREQAGELKK